MFSKFFDPKLALAIFIIDALAFIGTVCLSSAATLHNPLVASLLLAWSVTLFVEGWFLFFAVPSDSSSDVDDEDI